jgi:hypothetical protein
MDGSPDTWEGLPGVERGFEWSRLSVQCLRLAYEQVVSTRREKSRSWSRHDQGRGECESAGMYQERRWAAGG